MTDTTTEFKVTFEVPALKIDALLYKGKELTGSQKLERRIVWNLMAFLKLKGFNPTLVDDGDDDTFVRDPLEVMELLFNLDEARVNFAKQGHAPHTVLLIMGEGIDMICDYSFSTNDSDGFAAAMDEFDPEWCE